MTRSKPIKPKQKPAKAGAKASPTAPKNTVAERRIIFCEAYLSNGGNATQAAIHAGFAPKAAHVSGSRLLRDAKVCAVLDKRRQELAQKWELTTDAVLKNLAQAVYFDPRKLFKADGTLKTVTELDDDTAMALQSFEVVETSIPGKPDEDGKATYTQGFTSKIKWLDKNQARDQANKILGQYKDKVEVSVSDDFVKALERGYQRAASR
jgi:phage terminase small subunit